MTQGKPRGITSGRLCRSPTSHSSPSTSLGPGRLNIWWPSTTATLPALTARRSFLQQRPSGSHLRIWMTYGREDDLICRGLLA